MSPEAARAAIAVYLSHAKLSETYPDLEYNFWLRKAKELEKYMKTKIRVKSPDPNGIYHVWHFCMKCKQAIRHSTASMRDHLHRCRHEPKDFLTFPTTIKEIVIEVSG
ncbi:hypothetical protein JdFRA1000001_35c [uncultured archaeal virus]|uniref:Uncharacterized protein n=1 Tax=uncultured archaeal virus TaxID=1960247 RepID=A0A1S5Y2Y4_9VIRU|nr:hypothetical protein JdFRA1000001_35c [uncultured archaeal virus]